MNVIKLLRWQHGDYVFSSGDGSDADIVSSECMICFESIHGPFYYTHHLDKTVGIHKSCGELPGNMKHPLHPDHYLTIFKPYFNICHDYVCDVCFTISTVFKYRCTVCKFNVCYLCISNYVEGQPLKQKDEENSQYHQHKTQLLHIQKYRNPLDRYPICCCCHKFIEDSGHFCVQCGLSIHLSCFYTIPRQIKSSIHHHSLIAGISNGRNCMACLKKVDFIEFGCKDCYRYSFHISCVRAPSSLRLRVNEKVDLFYIDEIPSENYCGICCEEILRDPVYRSIELNKNFHVQCIMPPSLDHPYHHHPLTLTSSVQRKTLAEKYRCDVCEEEEDFEHYVYHCEECYFNAHIECLYSEESLFEEVKNLGKRDEVEVEDSSTQDGVEVQDSSTKDAEVEDSSTKDGVKVEESSTKDAVEVEDSNAQDHQADEDGEEQESDLDGCSLSELIDKMMNLTQHVEQLNEEIKQLNEEKHKSTVELTRVKSMIAKKNQTSDVGWVLYVN